MLCDGNTCRARATHGNADVADILLYNLESVEKSRSNNDSGSVLVIMENGNVAGFLESALDLEAAGCADILEVDSAKAAGEKGDGVYDCVNVLGANAKGERINICELLKEHALAFHNGHTCLGADVTKAENCGTVGNNGNEVLSAGKLIGLVNVLLDLKAGLGNAGSVCEGEILTVLNGNAGNDLDLAVPLIVLLKGFFSDIHGLIFLSVIKWGKLERDRRVRRNRRSQRC